jgi:hypothetical protein
MPNTRCAVIVSTLCSICAWSRPSSKQPAKRPDQPDRSVGGAEQQRAGIGGDLAAVERSHHLAPFDDFITKQVAATLCRHRGAPLHRVKSLSQKNYRRFRAPMHLPAVRNPG